MPVWVRIDEEEDYVYLRSLIRRGVEKCELNPGISPETADTSKRLLECLILATKDAPEKPQIEANVPEPKKTRKPATKSKKTIESPYASGRAPRGSRKADLPNLCSEHPSYGAQRMPRTECTGCWDAYEQINGKAATAQARVRFRRKHT